MKIVTMMRLWLFLLLLLIIPAYGVDIWSVKPSSSSPALEVFIEGEITPGDYQRLHSLFREKGPFVGMVHLFSPGGDVLEAIQIAEMFRALRLRTAGPEVDYDEFIRPVPECRLARPKNAANCVCNSACFLLWISGVERDKSVIGVHRPVITSPEFASATDAMAKKRYNDVLDAMTLFLDRYDVPQDLKEKMLLTSSRDISVIETPEGLTGLLPADDELIAARCGSLTKRQESRHYSLLVKERHGSATTEEIAEIRDLEPRLKEALLCEQFQRITRRVDAFSEYFKVDYMAKIRGAKSDDVQQQVPRDAAPPRP